MAHEIRSEMTASVWTIEVTDGTDVSPGDIIAILESMKMEIPVEADAAGTCTMKVRVGEAVQEGQIIATIE